MIEVVRISGTHLVAVSKAMFLTCACSRGSENCSDILARSPLLDRSEFLIAMLVDAQLRVDIRLIEASLGDPCIGALDGTVD